MHEERDEFNRMSQIAGMIAMLSAVVKTLPPSTRKRLMHQTSTEFESLLAAMSTTRAAQAETEREGVEWMRDLFLKRIAQADSKQKRRKVAIAKADPGQRTALETRSHANERPSSTDIDFEL